MRKGLKNIIGIDEAGRGPLAGPVVVAGVLYRGGTAFPKVLRGIKDSKKLSARQREEWFTRITACPDFAWAVARVSPVTIDRINILQASRLGARRVYAKLAPSNNVMAMLDGGLLLPAGVPQETIVKGDEKIPLIAAASIIAKVTRDRLMIKLHKKYPRYRFDLHKGYGTVLHRKFLVQFGPSPIHRASFHFKNVLTQEQHKMYTDIRSL